MGTHTKRRILAGTIARQHPDVLAAHLRTMRWQDADVELDLVYIDDSEEQHAAENRDHFHGANVRRLEPEARPDGASYRVDETTHHWAVPTFHFLAREKQRLLDLAVAERYDGIWLVDSDLLCARDTLRCLLEDEKPITSAVFWTQWTPDQPHMPQVWQRHPYGFDGAGWEAGEFLGALEARQLVKVRGLGACTLISTDALLKGAGFWPLLQGLPEEGMWQGEDRHFSIRAERAHIEMWADAWPKIFHCYRTTDRVAIPEMLDILAVPDDVKNGADVRFTIEPCEEPELALHVEHVRGRLGDMKVLNEIEEALRDMSVGDSRFVQIYYPPSWPIVEYRGAARTVRVRLLGADAS